ncbi:hypothetical protein V6O07_17920, partial [Arthrospira platensis SPKY2]
MLQQPLNYLSFLVCLWHFYIFKQKMAKATIEVIRALRLTADKLEKGSTFQWGHMGSCNCGNLAQTVTHFSKEEIHKYALEKRGNWSDQLIDYCPTSGYPMDMIIA